MACECRCRHFHINDDWLLVEPVDDRGEPVPDGVLSHRILLTNLYNYTQPFIRYEVTDRVIMHHEPCPCGNPSPWIELEGRTDDVTVFTEGETMIRIAPLSLYAVLKEVHAVRRFQLLVYAGNRIQLRLEEQEGSSRQAAFEEAERRIRDYLRSQGISRVDIALSEEQPRQDPGSGKFKHIVNKQDRYV